MSLSKVEMLTAVLLVLALIVSGMNVFAMSGIKAQAALTQNSIQSGANSPSNQNGAAVISPSAETIAQDQAILDAILPKGVPEKYGTELSVSFSDVTADNPNLANATIQKLGVLDQSITLSADDLNRYIPITNAISCEYCCGVPAITNAKGEAACGCAHSFAMRGLAKYLITQHGDEYTDIEILAELGKWKALFFPDNMVEKAKALQANNIPIDYVSLTSNQYRGIETQTAAQQQSTATGTGKKMVGGC